MSAPLTPPTPATPSTPPTPPHRPADAAADAAALPAESWPQMERRAAWLLGLLLVLLLGAALYLLYARGVFESTQRLVLIAEDSEGVVVGMDLTFAGFPIGRVRRIELGPDGNARLLVDVPRKDAHWLRTSSIFTLTRGVVGNTNLRAFSGMLQDPPLPDGAERKVLAGDATSEVTRVVTAARELLDNLKQLTGNESALAQTLVNVQALTGRAGGAGGALGVLTGNAKDADQLAAVLARSQQLLARLQTLATHTDAMVTRADAQVFGSQGVMPEVRASVQQLRALLEQTRSSLQRVDGVITEVQGAAKNVRAGTEDLAPLRADVEASLRKVDQLLNEINRKWPFKRDAELKLP